MMENLVNHMHWANSIIIGWMREDQNRIDEYSKLASHILNAERVWICRANRIQGDRNTFKVHRVEELSALNDANHLDFKKLLPLDLHTMLEYELFNGSPGKTSIENMLMHAFSHGFHHTGQMAAMASSKGDKFPDVSYIGFTRQAKI